MNRTEGGGQLGRNGIGCLVGAPLSPGLQADEHGAGMGRVRLGGHREAGEGDHPGHAGRLPGNVRGAPDDGVRARPSNPCSLEAGRREMVGDG